MLYGRVGHRSRSPQLFGWTSVPLTVSVQVLPFHPISSYPDGGASELTMSEWLWWDDLAAGIPRKFSLSYSTALILIRLMVTASPASATLAFVPACFHMGVRQRRGESPIIRQSRCFLGSAAWLRRTSPRIPINQ